MAKDNVAQLPTAEADAPKKRTRTEGPRKTKPIHVAFLVKDTQGNVIPRADISIVKVSKDFEDMYGVYEGDGSLSRVRIPLDKIA